MSIAVPLDELEARLADFPWGYLVTVRDDGRAQSLAVPTQYVDSALIASVGARAAANAAARPNVTLIFPGPTGRDMSLIVDGEAEIDGGQVRIIPTWAVMHRPALASAAE